MFLEQFQNYRIIVKILQGVPLYPISRVPHYKEPIMMPSYNLRPDFLFIYFFKISSVFPYILSLFQDPVWDRYFAESPSAGICLLFFSSGDWGNALWKEDHSGEVPFSSYPSKGTCYHDFSLLMLTFTAWLNIGLLMLPIAESFFFFWKCLCAALT